MKEGDEVALNGRIIRVRRHDIGHMRPPFLHDGMLRQARHRVILRPRQHAEQRVGLAVEMDRIVAGARLVQQIDQLRPDLVMPLAVFGFHAGIELHLAGVFF